MANTSWQTVGSFQYWEDTPAHLEAYQGTQQMYLQWDTLTRNSATSVTMTGIKYWHRLLKVSGASEPFDFPANDYRIYAQVPDGGTSGVVYIGSTYTDRLGYQRQQLATNAAWYGTLPDLTFTVPANATSITIKLGCNLSYVGNGWQDTGYQGWGAGWKYITQTIALPPVPHINASATGTGAVNDEGNPWLSYTNPSAANLDVKLELPDLGIYEIAGTNVNIGSPTSGTYTWSLSDSVRNTIRSAMANLKSTTLRATVHDQYSGTFSWKDTTITIVNANPTFSDFSFQDTNSTTTAITGNNQVMIAGKSTLQAKVSAAQKATPKKSATMSTYRFTLGADEKVVNYSSSADVTASLSTNTTAAQITVTAIDSRSNSTTATKSITVVPYSSPTLSASGRRSNGFENSTTISIGGNISLIQVGGTAKNTVDSSTGVQYRYKAASSNTWGNWTSRTSSLNTSTGAVTVADFTINLDNQQAYDFQVKITDKLETTTVSFQISVGQPLFWVGTDGRIGVGGMPTQSKISGESGLLDVKGRVFENGHRLISNTAGSVAKTNMATSSVGLSALDNSEMGTLVWAGYAGFNKRTYNNGYIVLENLVTLMAAPGCSGKISLNKLNMEFTLPTSGSYYAEVYGQLWINNNPWDYIIFGVQKNQVQFGRAMAPRPNGSWGFVELTHPTTIANGDKIEWHLNTNGNNFSDGNMSIADSYTYIKIYKVGN